MHRVASEDRENLGGFEDLEVIGAITILNSWPKSGPSSPNLDLKEALLMHVAFL